MNAISSPSKDSCRLLVFRRQNQYYCIALEKTLGVLSDVRLFTVPRVKSNVEGVIIDQGRVLGVFKVGHTGKENRLHTEAEKDYPYRDNLTVIVLDSTAGEMAIEADQVIAVWPKGEFLKLNESPGTEGKNYQHMELTGQPIHLLDPENILATGDSHA